MPTNTQRLVGALATISITFVGAWLASNVHSTYGAASAATSFPSGLTVTLEGVRGATGKVVVIVFSNRNAFRAYDVAGAAGYKETPSKAGTVVVSFPDLKDGPYAVAAFHDEDENRDLNMKGQLPTEGYATSGAVDAYDTPTFRTAAIVRGKVTIKMHYPD
ncbi:DUF2141 domain-containing protein [Anderseniella sp. Alg231-50]|uniref:DUF2141 domain-containing protein n=1 Tax=Anderseniella sp. Alg231-50 TaxID=1922226 RepID=UPI000D54B5ED